MTVLPKKKPVWLKKKIPTGPNYRRVNQLLTQYSLHTVCQEARCPNRLQCFQQGTATFLLLGEICTRNCRFCAVKQGSPEPLDLQESYHIAKVVQELGLSFVVLTAVTRDDLPDGGADIFYQTIQKLRDNNPDIKVEALVPDFCGSPKALERVLASNPNVLNHNMETVADLYADIRPQADYERSLELLARAAKHCPDTIIKSGLMLGLGESDDGLVRVMEDLLQAGCTVLTLGQYLQPSTEKAPVARYLHPDEFALFHEKGLSMGFTEVVAGPYVRSSFLAKEAFYKAIKTKKGAT